MSGRYGEALWPRLLAASLAAGLAVFLVGLVLGVALTVAYRPTKADADAGAGDTRQRAVLLSSNRVVAVGAENEYANVISQIGGKYVKVSAIVSNPNTDPHEFEASPSVAREVAAAQLVVQNGLGYDSFMQTIESGSPSSRRKVITVQTVLGKPSSTANPHLWYAPGTMPAVAKAIEKDLATLEPLHRSYFSRNLSRFDASLRTWRTAIGRLRATFEGAPVATTEPVADYLLQACGIDNKTPFGFQKDIMNGVDPSPQDVAYEENLLSHKKVKAFVYNEQVTDTLTQSLLGVALRAHVPVVGVYETMPVPGYDYQSWMVAEVTALKNALAHGISARKL